jgi:hypothetical protein
MRGSFMEATIAQRPGDEGDAARSAVSRPAPRPETDEGAFAFGLDLILDGLERIRDTTALGSGYAFRSA